MEVTKELAEAFTKWQKDITREISSLGKRVSRLEDIVGDLEEVVFEDDVHDEYNRDEMDEYVDTEVKAINSK